jgi:hypothetical protein
MKALQITNVTGLHSLPVQPQQVGAVPLQTTVVPLDSTADNGILSGGLLSTIIEFMLVMMIMKMMMGMMSGMNEAASSGPVTYPYAKG